MSEIQNLDLISVGVTVAAIGILGFVIFFNNKKSVTSQSFLLFSLVTIAWGVINYLSYKVESPLIALWMLRLVIFFAVWQVFFLFHLFYVFPGDEIKYSRFFNYFVIPVSIFTSILNLTPFVFKEFKVFLSSGQVSVIQPGPGIFIFAAVTIGLALGSIILLIMKVARAKGLDRTQLLYVLVGVFISLALLSIFNLIIPIIFDNTKFIPLGALFMLPFVSFTFYAILKHRLLKIKIITTEIITFVLAIVTLIEVILSDSVTAIVLRSGIFTLVLAFGILLIRSVMKEVEQRERLETLTKELGAANDKLKELDHLKSEFLSFASHQIKAPLASIKGFATLIFDGTYGEVPEKVREAALKIKESVDRMVRLVTDSLNIRKIEEGKMNYKFENVDACKLIQDIFDELKPLADKKKLEFSMDASTKGCWISADIQNVRQVFQNLIENAIKYTDSGFVKIRTETYGAEFLFSVSDSGMGISKDLLPHLFEEFRREVATKNIEGTGLGLFIAHEIVRAHRGEIWVESDGLGKGSKFLVKFPLA